MIRIWDAMLKLPVAPAVRPTVPSADTASYRASVRAMGEVALMSSLQLGYVPLLFVGMFVFIMLAGPGKVSVDYLLSLYFTNKDSLNELKNF